MRKHKHAILITGAAKRIGAATALHLAQQGHDVVLHYHRSGAAAKMLAKRCLQYGGRVTLVQADLSDAAAIATLFKTMPRITALIHNASCFERDTLATMQPHRLRRHLALHQEAPLWLAHHFMRQLPTRTQGAILLLGDGAMGWSVAPQFFSYAISKHALESCLDVLAAAVAPRARVNLIAPGVTLAGKHDSPSTLAKLAAAAPLQRNGCVDEVLAAVDYVLASPGLTGQILNLANGFALRSFRRGLPAK